METPYVDVCMGVDSMDGEDALVAILNGDSDSDEGEPKIRTTAVFNFPSPPLSPRPECKASRRFICGLFVPPLP